jgi:DNA-binding NarL/FixJ family response regulator
VTGGPGLTLCRLVPMKRSGRPRPSAMPNPPPITVAIARFEDLLGLGLGTLLADDPSVSIVAHDIAYERIGVVLRAHRPRALILDVAGLRDLAQVRELCIAHPQTRLVLLGEGLRTAESAQLLAFGASACLAKDTQARDVRNAIHLASRGLQLMPLGAPDAGDSPVTDPLLTQREGDVLLLLRQGRSNAQIALALQIGVETVRTHARNIYRKLGVSSRRALTALASPASEPPVPAPARPARHRAPSRVAARRRLHD